MLKAIFFDLDGTLLGLDEKEFAKAYFGLLAKEVAPLGYDPKELVDVIWKGTEAMVTNNGKVTNHDRFWEVFRAFYGEEKQRLHEPIFDNFYSNGFKQSIAFTEPFEISKKIVRGVIERGLLPVLSTNAIFPMAGQVTRLSFLGLTPFDFTFITSYENSSFCKPNPLYFKSLLDRFQLRPEEVLVFGNNDYEDGDCARLAGIKAYLVDTGYLIHSPHCKTEYETIRLEDILSTIDKHLDLDR